MKTINTKAIIPILKSNDIKFAGIFGSHAKGKATKKSDVDILIKFKKPKGFFELARLQRKLSKALKNKVDLVTVGALHPYIKKEVLKTVKIIYGKK